MKTTLETNILPRTLSPFLPCWLFLCMLACPLHAATVPAGKGFSLAWDYPNLAGAQITGYTVYEQTATGNLVAERSGPGVLRVLITPRPLGTHTYVVTATAASGMESAPSQPVVVQVVPVVPPTPSVPGQVQGLTGVLANGNLTLTWSPRPMSEAVTHYIVEDVRAGSAAMVATVTVPPLIVINPSAGTHNYYVTATNAVGKGPISATYTVNVIPPPQNVPVAPVNFRYEDR